MKKIKQWMTNTQQKLKQSAINFIIKTKVGLYIALFMLVVINIVLVTTLKLQKKEYVSFT